ncbi:MAG: phospholipase [Bacteroidales bacterium]|nr:phospholipase [Bacteroidales bacterium]
MIQYIADRDHYSDVLTRCERVKHDLWIGTADLKDLYVGSGNTAVPFLSVVDKLLRRGVEVRLLHAKEPGDNFRADFDKYPGLWSKLERRLCPRVHFKIVIFDCAVAYIGSANLTGAGIGMKADGTRNFEAGILTDDPQLVDAAANHIDSVWQGAHCKTCKRKDFCTDRIA